MGCVLQGVMSGSFVYECALRVLFKGHREVGREMIVVVKCRGEEAGNMLLRRTRRSAHNNCWTRRLTHNNLWSLVNVHDDLYQ